MRPERAPKPDEPPSVPRYGQDGPATLAAYEQALWDVRVGGMVPARPGERELPGAA